MAAFAADAIQVSRGTIAGAPFGPVSLGREPAAGGHTRTAVLATADGPLREKLAAALRKLRWEVRPAGGGAEAILRMESGADGTGTRMASTLIVDSWLPDLEVRDLVRELAEMYPQVDVLAIDGTDLGAPAARGAYRHEVLLALRGAEQGDAAAWAGAPSEEMIRGLASSSPQPVAEAAYPDGLPGRDFTRLQPPVFVAPASALRTSPFTALPSAAETGTALATLPLPEFIGVEGPMLEVSRRIRLVAPRSTPVLIQGPTGTGKELVARALHRLSPRASKPFVALNCAAIPEALLESELFGHTRGAFTGAVQGRVGRIEAAHGGTLFLDEIGELPLALQAKLLRFVECGEIQRVGENEPVRVDVRIVAATHRRLGQMAADGAFRADLFYRLSVFLIRTPALREHAADLPLLVDHFLRRMGRTEPQKQLTDGALRVLCGHGWPGNVRELEHVLERAWILAEERSCIEDGDIDFGELDAQV